VVSRDEILYVVDSIDLNENLIKVMKLYDINGIKVNQDYYKNRKMFINFKFSDLDSRFKILSLDESQAVLDKFSKSLNILTVYYELDQSEELINQGIISFIPKRSKIRVVSMSPENIDESIYDVVISANVITDVKTKSDNIKVLFKAEERKNSCENLEASVKIYYSIYKNSINILHVHKIQEQINTKNYEAIYLEKPEDAISCKIFNEMDQQRLRVVFKKFQLNFLARLEFL